MLGQRITFSLSILLAVVCVFGGVLWAQELEPVVVEGAAEAAPEAVVEVVNGYLAEVTGEQVYVRSGPAEVYYDTTVLGKGEQVIVRGEDSGWAKIEPTAGCFSYVSKKYVRLRDYVEPVSEVTDGDAAAGAEAVDGEVVGASLAPLGKELVYGEVIGNRIRVRAGSQKVPPANANQVQGYVNRGDVVKIIGVRDDYYKIVCRAGTYFWVSKRYLKRVGAVTEEVEKASAEQVSLGALHGESVTGTTKEGLAALEKDRGEYRAIAKLVETESAKPVADQKLVLIRERLAALLGSTQLPSVKASGEVLSRQVTRMEMAQGILLESRAETARLQEALAKIEQRVEGGPAALPDEMMVEGRLVRSAVFTAEKGNVRYLVLDDQETILFYAVSTSGDLDLGVWVGRKVTLIGRAKYDAASGIRVLYVNQVVVPTVATPQEERRER